MHSRIHIAPRTKRRQAGLDLEPHKVSTFPSIEMHSHSPGTGDCNSVYFDLNDDTTTVVVGPNVIPD